MKNEYQAYVREIDGQLFFFVKNFISISELPNIDPVLVGYGMHLQFEKACAIAGVMDAEERRKIYSAIYSEQASLQAKVVSITTLTKTGEKKIS